MDRHPEANVIAMNSGVIEMRTLASRHASGDRVSTPTMDMVLAVPVASAPLAAPLDVRIARSPSSSSGRTAMQALAASLVFAMSALAGLAWMSPQERDVATEVTDAATPDLPKPLFVAEVSPQERAVVVPESPVVPAATEAPARRRSRASAPSASSPSSAPSSSLAASTSGSTPASNASASIEELMRRASDAPEILPAARTAPVPSNTTTPSREQVRTAMAELTPAVNACAGGTHGLASVTVVFSGDTGRVRSAVVNGNYAGTPEGSCIARAVRNAELPSFSQSTFTVSYPFAI